MSAGDSGSTKLKNGLLKIPKILSWLMSILSLWFSWISIQSEKLTLEWYIIAIIIIGNSVFLIAFSLYEGFLYKKYTSQIALIQAGNLRDKERSEAIHKEKMDEINKQNERLNIEKEHLLDDIEGLKGLNETVIVTFLQITNKYNFYSLKLQAINDTYVSKVKKLAQVNKKVLDSDSGLEDIKKHMMMSI